MCGLDQLCLICGALSTFAVGKIDRSYQQPMIRQARHPLWSGGAAKGPGSVDPEGVPTTGARGCPPENFLEIQLWNPSFWAIFIIIEFTKS